MAIKSISFTGKDEELLKDIRAFQKREKIPNFIDAVRILCNTGLKFKEISR